MAWTAVSAFVLDQVFGYQTANFLRENLIALARAKHVYPLGGSRTTALGLVASAQDAVDWIDIELDGTEMAGLTKTLRVECRTLDASTTITPKLRNVTDSTDAATGAAAVGTAADYSGTNQKQSVSVTVASGVKKYRLMGTPSTATHDTFVIGYLEIYASA